ncbi:MAG: hypothetical protein KC615_07455 [Anaerolineae bacterium]|nr:hypothetical protein [Anaerolineae bacterium]
MENNALTEKGLLATLNAALAIHAHAEIMHLFTELACLYIGKGLTQEGADLLAFILKQPELEEGTRHQAADAYDDLASYICPRVLFDAQDFASKARLEDVIDYVFASVDVE